jgi:hypothetical protein
MIQQTVAGKVFLSSLLNSLCRQFVGFNKTESLTVTMGKSRIPNKSVISVKDGEESSSSLKFYLFQNGLVRIIPDNETALYIIEQYAHRLVHITQEMLSNIPKDIPLPSRINGSVLVGKWKDTWCILNGYRHLIKATEWFSLLGCEGDWRKFIAVSYYDLDGIPLGGSYIDRPVKPFDVRKYEGVAVKFSAGREIFLVRDGFRHSIPNMDTFYSLNLTLSRVTVLDYNDLMSIPLGVAIEPLK